MRLDENLSTVYHPEMTTNSNWFTELFLTDYCKALSCARFCNDNFHVIEIKKSESKVRLLIEYIIRFGKNRTLTSKEINVLLYFEHESLPSLGFHYHYNYKYSYLFNNSKHLIYERVDNI